MWDNVIEVQFDSFLEASCITKLTHETPPGMVAWDVEHNETIHGFDIGTDNNLFKAV